MLKAIETRYKGYRMRSRLEARWAVFLDTLGVRWEYEAEGYELSHGRGRYLPDFWLEAQQTWLEIKPGVPSQDELLKLGTLVLDADKFGVMVAGAVGEERLTLFHRSYGHKEVDNPVSVWAQLFYRSQDRVIQAYYAARAVRFEHGENGNVR